MAERQNTKWVDSEVVQGPGSFVVVRKLGYGQRQAATKMLSAAFGGQLPTAETLGDVAAPVALLDANDAFTRELLAENVAAWNWVDDAGELLPLPRVAAEVIDELTDEEVTFLVKAIRAGVTADAAKN